MKNESLKKRIAGLSAVVILLGSMSTIAFAEYNRSTAIFSAEFDGQDTKTYWMTIDDNDKPNNPNFVSELDGWVNKDGVLELKRTNHNNAKGLGVGASFGEGLDVSSKSKLVWETRFKYNHDSYKKGEVLPKTTYFFFGYDPANKASKRIGASITSDGYFAYGGKGDGSGSQVVKTGLKMYDETWYTVRFIMDFVGDDYGMTCYIQNDETKEQWESNSSQKAKFFGSSISKIIFLRGPLSWNNNKADVEIDYMRVWDDGFALAGTAIKDKATGVSTDTDYIVKFTDEPLEATLSGITVEDADGNKVPLKIIPEGNNARLYFETGLKYNEKYTVKIPATVSNVSNETITAANFEFTTEDITYIIETPEATISGNTATASMKVKNMTEDDRNINVLTAVYSGGRLVKLVSETIVAPKGTNGIIKATPIDITGIENPEAKAYVWSI